MDSNIGMSEKKKFHFGISFNSPVILTFTFICLGALILGKVTNEWTTTHIFSVYKSSFADPLTYVRFFGHIFGHAGWEHFLGNIMYILVVGPLLEEKYGSSDIAVVIGVTAVITGLIHMFFFPNTMLLGASGVVFAFILLSSITSIKEGKIPMTFILVAVVYLGQQVYDGIFVNDNVSNLTHIIGGITGAALGFFMNKSVKDKNV